MPCRHLRPSSGREHTIVTYSVTYSKGICPENYFLFKCSGLRMYGFTPITYGFISITHGFKFTYFYIINVPYL